MASAFDEERKKLGITTYSNTKSSMSAFDADRMDLGLMPDTRPKAEARQLEPPKTQAQSHDFGNRAGDIFSGKLPASQLLTVGTGGPKNASNLLDAKIDPNTEYAIQQKRINNTQSPSDNPIITNIVEGVKNAASNLNYLTRNTKAGRFVSNSLSGNSGVVQRDSTGSKAADKVSDVINTFVTPLLEQSGAPYGQGIIGSTYKAAGKLANTKPVMQYADYLSNSLLRSSLIPNASKEIADKVARVILTETVAGAPQGAGFGLMQGQDSTEEIINNAKLGSAAGGLLAGGGAILSEAAGSLASGLRGRVPGPAAPEIDTSTSTLERQARPSSEMSVRTSTAPDYTVPANDAEYQTLFKRIQQGTEGGNQSLLSRVANDIKSRGGLQSVDELKDIGENVLSAKARGMSETEALDRMQNFIEGYGPVKQTSDIVVEPLQLARKDQIPPSDTPIPVTEATPGAPKQRGFTETLKASDKTPEPLKAKLNNEYQPITNLETVKAANERVARDVSNETNRILGTTKFSAEDSVVAQRLIDHYNKQNNYEMSVNIADKIATEATKAGQFIQSLSIYDRLTPEGVLIHARRIANKVNETASKLGKQAEVTPKMAEDIVSLAGVTQKMTGVKDLSSNVIDILERAKSGEKLTSNEASQLERFVKESKQFIKETTKPAKPPKAPTAPKDKRVRDNVSSFLDAQEQAAKERLRAKGIRISSTPLDIWADYAVIGAAKMGKGVIKFADWSEQMVKDLGEDIRPQLTRLYESSKDAFNLTSKKIGRETISDAERLAQKVIKEKQLTGEEAESLLNIAQRVSALSGEAKRTASQDLQTILQSLDKPSLLRKIASAQTQAQLLNPKTQVRNVLGNELFYRLERINKYVSTPIDIARSKLTGSDRTVTFRSFNQGKYWSNWLKGGSAGARGVNINGLETQFDLASPAFTGKYNPLRYTEKALGASLRSFDNAAYSRAVNKSLGEMATLDAINSGVKPTKEYVQNFIAKADDNVRQLADNYGKYVTFQDNNLISQGLTKFKRGLNLGKDFGFGDLVLKYPKTPGALLARALEYSPAGFIRSAWQVAKPIFRNGVEKDPAAVVQGLSRAIIGTFGLSGLGYYLIQNDILTGQANKDRDIRSLQSAAGQGQYQVNLSALERFVKSGFDPNAGKIKEGDLLYNYDWMQPVSVAISMGANIQKNMSNNESKGKVATGALGAAYDSFAGGLNTLTEQSVLQGLARAAEGYPGQTVTDKIADVLSDVPASFIPTIFNQVKQLTDNTKRETTDPTLLEQTLNKAQAKIPGLAGKLPKKYDSLGNEQQHYQNNSAANVFLNPGFPSRYKLSDEARMIVDLIAETGDEGIAPRVPNKKLDGTPLTGEEFSRLSQLQGENTRNSLGKVKESLSNKSKIKSIKKKLTTSGQKARKELEKEFPRLQAKP
ncbi:hypothetical protein MHH28_07625 [Paenibacillus sp. FSL K6-1217]|uniref:hypothetical protein n=1 Tax=Paenibacillus sp. FSL K6-1217 TaxID=2921466 RepID=UPI00325082BA